MQAAGGAEASPSSSVIEEDAEKKAEDEAAAKKEEEEEAAKKKALQEEEEARKKAAEEESKKKVEEEAKRKKAEEEAKKKAEEEEAKRKAEEEASKSKADEEKSDEDDHDDAQEIEKRKAMLSSAAASLSFSKTSPRNAQSSPPTVRVSQVAETAAADRATSRSAMLKANRARDKTPEAGRKEADPVAMTRTEAGSKSLSARVSIIFSLLGQQKKFAKNLRQGTPGFEKEPTSWSHDCIWHRWHDG